MLYHKYTVFFSLESWVPFIFLAAHIPTTSMGIIMALLLFLLLASYPLMPFIRGIKSLMARGALKYSFPDSSCYNLKINAATSFPAKSK